MITRFVNLMLDLCSGKYLLKGVDKGNVVIKTKTDEECIYWHGNL